ncbi:MAG: double-strand break repair helicase AddA [Sphingomonadaceae bacterium]|nr:double-strand break repair helicase AddA [Sphingomonadaceae bacterium]
MRLPGAHPPLMERQAEGADPLVNAWVSASAGAGKTQLLTARILRLLLTGAPPESILALTFTKAAAAEMQSRVLGRLMRWAGAGDAEIGADLVALGLKAPSPELIVRARQLFARALDARGGLQVQTIHAFAGRLLAAFPIEAGVSPAFETLDDRAATELERKALDAALANPPPGFLDDLASLSLRHGEGGALDKLRKLAQHGELLIGWGALSGFEARLRAALGLPRDGIAEAVLADEIAKLSDSALARVAALFERHPGGRSKGHAEAIRAWLAHDCSGRHASWSKLTAVFITAEGTGRSASGWLTKAICAADPDCPRIVAAIQAQMLVIEDLRCLLECAAEAARHKRAAAVLAGERARIQREGGWVTYGDLITRAARLLGSDGAGEWVRWKLDSRIDHILVDEAQDTNRDQWAIIGALSSEFGAGEGARGSTSRSVFAVGDRKQSIFGFQGADPRQFAEARQRLAERGVHVPEVALAVNFRSGPAVLAVVDQLIARAGAAAFGLDAGVSGHEPARKAAPGSVTLWEPIPAVGSDEETDSERGWISTAQRTMAARVAAQVKAWLAQPLWLEARGRALRPEDILILVRKRGEFVGAVVAALGQAGVPVAGADRLDLHAPIAAKDVKSLMRFVLQPGDDLSLAELLVSPLIGLSQDQLFAAAYGRERATLWQALTQSADPAHARAAAWLRAALAIADWAPPSEFLERILSLQPFDGRKRVLARLGAGAADVLDALVSAARRFEATHTPSLQGFLAWLDAGELPVKRNPDAPRAEVRVMTVHGAKGLQAPVVILADAAADDDVDREGHVPLEIDGVELPCFHPGRGYLKGPLAAAAEAKAERRAQEEMRLLYVALTRAEDLLFVGGALGKKAKDGAGAQSWWRRVEGALIDLGAEWADDAVFGRALTHRVASDGAPTQPLAPSEVPQPPPLPDWSITPAPTESRPPRPLAPSRLTSGDAARPPGSAGAARRGRLLHGLFERAEHGLAAQQRWLDREAPELDAAARAALTAEARAIIDDPANADLFGADAIPEAPIAAVLDSGIVIAGRLDRLVVTPARIRFADFKTGLRPPRQLSAIPPAHLRQMAGYRAALARVFPGRAVEAALIYVAGPRLFALPDALLAGYDPVVTFSPRTHEHT